MQLFKKSFVVTGKAEVQDGFGTHVLYNPAIRMPPNLQSSYANYAQCYTLFSPPQMENPESMQGKEVTDYSLSTYPVRGSRMVAVGTNGIIQIVYPDSLTGFIKVEGETETRLF